jgi:hypothetical protein
MTPPPTSSPSGRQLAMIAGLVVLGLLLLCGLAGTCLLVVSFFFQSS